MHFYFSELRTLSTLLVLECVYALCVSSASVSVYRSMTALSVVTVAFPTEGCVDEHMEQDGEVCIHPPLQRFIVSIAICLVVLTYCSEQRAQADVCQTQELNSCEQECYRFTSWRKRFSLGMARISSVVHSHGQFFQR